MKKLVVIALTQVFLLTAKAGCLNIGMLLQQKEADTSINNSVVEDSIISEVLKTKMPPQKEKVQYFSQVTKYGFKNLFAQYNYNPALPYSVQVNPNAESYMQDYLKAHSNHLIQMKGWGQPYFNLIDNILSQYGLPR